jgi:hypothetical protein
VVTEALQPLQNQKRVIVVISDGLDRGSKATFEETLAALQTENIMVYACKQLTVLAVRFVATCPSQG